MIEQRVPLQKTIMLASRYLKSLDKDGDGVVNKAEQAKMRFYKDADLNGDGKITVIELAKTMSLPNDDMMVAEIRMSPSSIHQDLSY